MADQNESPDVIPSRTSYFGTDERYTLTLPDGEQCITHRKLTEGDRKKLQDTGYLSMKRGSDEMSMPIRIGTERHTLLKLALVDWNLVGTDGRPAPFNEHNMAKFLRSADPDIITMVEDDIRKHNKFLMLQGTVEDVEKEIDRLNEQLAVLKEQEAKNLS